MRMLEVSLGQALLTLTLDQQRIFFEECFCHFAKHGIESPNLRHFSSLVATVWEILNWHVDKTGVIECLCNAAHR